MVGTVTEFEFNLRLPKTNSNFIDTIQANTRPLAEQIIKSKYPGVIILSYKNLGMLKGLK